VQKHLQKFKIFEIVGKAADELNCKAMVVGGYVRDLILNRPSKDIDIVVEGKGIELAEKVAKALQIRNVNVFKNFGTAQFNFEDWDIEFVGARKESYQRNSRNPIVETGTIKDDQLRRDFTINAMGISLNKSTFGELIDPFNGIADIEKKRIVTPQDPIQTFSDDPLRMLRAIRFASQLEFNIDPITYQSIVHNAYRLEIITIERIMDEFNKIMLSPKPSIGINLLNETKLLHQFFPELIALQGVKTVNGKSHKDNYHHTLQVLDNICLNTNDLWLRWAALLHDIAKPKTQRYDEENGWTFHGHEALGASMTPKIFKRLKLPLNEKLKYVQKLVALHLRPIVLSKEIVTDSAVRRLLFDAGDDLDDLMKLCEADITSKNEFKVQKYLRNFRVVREKIKDVEERDSIRNWKNPVTGELIMSTFNIGPCKLIGEIKEAVKDAIFDGIIPNDSVSAIQYMEQKGFELGLTITKFN
jgi:putative nucleotidyltransferase with HDIG domain